MDRAVNRVNIATERRRDFRIQNEFKRDFSQRRVFRFIFQLIWTEK